MSRYVIIGSGAAGFAAAEAIRSRDRYGEIMMIGDDPFGYYSRPGLAFYLTGELPEDLLYPVRVDYLRSLDIGFIRNRVTRLEAQSHLAWLEDGQSLSYDRLLIAIGAAAAPMKTPGVELLGVVKLDSMDDARQIIKQARKARTAVVVGGGITALELVEGLAANRVKVHYFLRGDRYWNSVLDEMESRIVEHRLIEEGVKIHYGTELDSILGKKGKVVGVRTKDGETIRCEMLAYAIGVKPRTRLAEISGLECEKGILVDEYLQTSAPDVYAAGDVAQVYDPFSGKRVVDSLWTPAKLQGRQAGLNMAGCVRPYYKGVPFNVTRLAGLTTTIIGTVGSGGRNEVDLDLAGIARGDSETWRQLPDAIAAQTGFDVNRMRILVGRERIMGALVMGDQTLSQPLQQLVNEQVDITPIHAELLSPSKPLADTLMEFYKRWRQNLVPVQ